jgi:Probable cobalt transporter subunit (CbtB)
VDEVTPAVEHVRVPAAAWIAALFGLIVLYVVLEENGAVLASNWHSIHEYFHDGRHFLGVPCH